MPNRKATTAANYERLMAAYLLPRLGATRLKRITPAQIQRIYDELCAGGGRGGRALSGSHVHNIHRVLHATAASTCIVSSTWL